MLKYFPLAILLSSLATPAFANVGGEDLKKYCEDTSSVPYQMYCIAYIQGVVDALHSTDSILARTKIGPLFLCEPPTVTNEQRETLVRIYLANHPEKLKYAAFDSVAEALSQVYPCPEKPN